MTDLDIKRAKCEKGEKHKNSETCGVCGQQAEGDSTFYIAGAEPNYVQITSLIGRTTTNATLKGFNQQLRDKPEEDADKLDDIEFFEDDNLYVVFQKEPIKGQYATSLEESLILTNDQNDIINDVIKDCKPEVYIKILNEGGEKSRTNLIHNSYKLQKKLSDSKSDFSNKLLFSFLSAAEGDVLPQLPNYLEDGLDWLVTKLRANDTPSSSLAETPVTVEVESTITAVTEATSDDGE